MTGIESLTIGAKLSLRQFELYADLIFDEDGGWFINGPPGPDFQMSLTSETVGGAPKLCLDAGVNGPVFDYVTLQDVERAVTSVKEFFDPGRGPDQGSDFGLCFDASLYADYESNVPFTEAKFVFGLDLSVA